MVSPTLSSSGKPRCCVGDVAAHWDVALDVAASLWDVALTIAHPRVTGDVRNEVDGDLAALLCDEVDNDVASVFWRVDSDVVALFLGNGDVKALFLCVAGDVAALFLGDSNTNALFLHVAGDVAALFLGDGDVEPLSLCVAGDVAALFLGNGDIVPLAQPENATK